ncbi:adhesion G protein-coupled receptor A3 isoform X2 [Planococcus citri]|uniref:adhesion G protein-coupled receptor A3 isoform X2 n=1 Tax=Planococcus citri TaxID=170843 RepID=UPI0031F75071
MSMKLFIFVTSIILFHWRFEVTASCPGIPDTNCNCSSKAPKGNKNATTLVKLQMKCTHIERIEDLSFQKTLSSNISIPQLDLSDNNITVLPYESFVLTKLNKLDLGNNRINRIEKGAFLKLKILKTLILSNNKLETIDRETFEGLQSLENCDLGNNNINFIDSEAFSRLKNLKALTISNNQLEKLDKEMFEGLQSLERLKLANNRLITLPEEATLLTQLKYLDISGNPWVCSCDIWWLRTTTHIDVQEPRPTCVFPELRTEDSLSLLNTYQECSWERDPISDFSLHLNPEEDQIVFEGDSLHLLCELDEHSAVKNNEELHWTLEGQDPVAMFPTSVRSYYDRNEGLSNVLMIENIVEKHAGEWSCHFISPYVNKSSSITVVVISKRTTYCDITVTDTNKGRYIWPETVSGRKVSLPCELEEKNQPFPYATYFCASNATWFDLNTSNCPYMSNITRILQESSKMNLTHDRSSLIESAVSLRNFTSENVQNMANAVDFLFIVTTIENYLPYLEKEPELGKYLIEIVNCALKLPREFMEKAQQQHAACSRLQNAIENILKFSSMSEFHNDELVIKEILLSSEQFPGMTCSWIKGPNGVLDSVNCSFTNKTILKGQDVEASIQLPSTLFHPEFEIIPSSDYHLMVAMFRDNRLFPDKISYKESSSVFAMNLIDMKTDKLEKPIQVKVKNYGYSDPKLAWWDMELGIWRTDGCRMLTGGMQNWLSFQCNRMGYFTLFNEQDDNMHFEKEKPMFNFLHPSIYVGTFISVTCLLLASATYLFCYSHIQMSKKMKHSLANTWLSTSLLFLIFSVGIHQTEQDKLCKVIGLLIHYFVLATLFWMAVTIKALYKRIQKSNPSVSTPSEDIPADVTIQKPILGIYLVGWGIPSIICGIAGAVNIRGYSSSRYCFLNPGPELSTVLIPASLVLFYLLIMCLLVKCATGSPDSNPQLSVGTQAIDLELLDGGGRNSFTQERCSVRSITTPSSQAEDTEHSPGRQLKAFVIYLVLYLLATVSAALCVMLPLRWPYEEKIFSFTYALLCFLLGSFVIFFHCFARNDIRSSWSDLLGSSRFRKSPHIIANSLIPPVSFRPDSNDPVSGVVSKPASVEENSAKSEFMKQTPNINLVRLHRQHYRGCNTQEADNFYNPHQSIVAKKFFKKQRRKRSTLQVRKCRSGGSSPVSAGLFEDSAKATGTRTDDENTKFLSNSNEQYDEFSSEKHPLTYDEPDITGCEGKTGTESEATFTVPEYAEIQEHSLKYGAPPYQAETKEQMCGTSDRDWCSCDAISDVNSEPTYNYAYIKNGYESSRSVMSDTSSVNSHLYTAVAPDVVSSSMDRHRRRFNYRPPPRTTYRTGRVNVNNGNFHGPPTTADFKRRRKDILYKIPKEVNPAHFGPEADKLEPCIIRTTHYPDIV